MSPLLASTALGLVAAWPVGALGYMLGRAVERLTDDPRPRAAVWSLAHALPAGALAATVALTLAPIATGAPAAKPVAAPAAAARVTASLALPATSARPTWTPPAGLTGGLAWSLIGLSAAGLLVRGGRWTLGRRQLAAIRAAAAPCTDAVLLEAVRQRAKRLGVAAPAVRISDQVVEPLLVGVRRPTILLPKTVAETAGAARLALVCGHELAHQRRGDNWRIPAEEALAGLFWLAPPVAALRARMLAAREAVCDRTALDGAAPEARQDYARALVDTLKTNALPSPQSAFTGRTRTLAAMRLTAILHPRAAASAGRVTLAIALGGALTAATGAGSLALAQQAREAAPPKAPVEPPAAMAPAATPETAEPAAPAVRHLTVKTVVTKRDAQGKPTEITATSEGPGVLTVNLSKDGTLAHVSQASPDPHPNPQPKPQPNPQPDPQPSPQAKADVVTVAADHANQNQATHMMTYNGNVTAEGRLSANGFTLKVNGQPAPTGFQFSDLPPKTIQRMEITNKVATTDGKTMINIITKDAAQP